MHTRRRITAFRLLCFFCAQESKKKLKPKPGQQWGRPTSVTPLLYPTDDDVLSEEADSDVPTYDGDASTRLSASTLQH